MELGPRNSSTLTPVPFEICYCKFVRARRSIRADQVEVRSTFCPHKRVIEKLRDECAHPADPTDCRVRVIEVESDVWDARHKAEVVGGMFPKMPDNFRGRSTQTMLERPFWLFSWVNAIGIPGVTRLNSQP